MPRRQTERAVADAAPLETARRAAGARGAGSQDPLIGELRRAGLLPLLVLHFLAGEPSYGNQLMERITELTGGADRGQPEHDVSAAALARGSRASCAGEWEHPERRSRRFYRLTPAGQEERDRLAVELGPRLDAIAAGIDLIRRELEADAARRVGARIDVPGQASDAEALWYDLRRWPSFVDGCKYIARVDGDWPAAGALVVWDSFPGGRGRVLEEVTAYEARVGQRSRSRTRRSGARSGWRSARTRTA